MFVRFLLIGLIALAAGHSYAAPMCRLLIHNSQVSAASPELTLIIGTDRQGSNSSIVAGEILNALTQNLNARINLIDLAQVPRVALQSDYFAAKPPAFVNGFVRPIERSQGLIFVIPEYDGAVPGILSLYMNHMRASLENKVVSLVGISAGRWGARSALDAFKGTLTHRKANVAGNLQVNIESINDKVADNRVTDTDSASRLSQAARELVRNLKFIADYNETLNVAD